MWDTTENAAQPRAVTMLWVSTTTLVEHPAEDELNSANKRVPTPSAIPPQRAHRVRPRPCPISAEPTGRRGAADRDRHLRLRRVIATRRRTGARHADRTDRAPS